MTFNSVNTSRYWNAATNVPPLRSGIGITGTTYIVEVPGTTNIDGVSDWAVGDFITFGLDKWYKIATDTPSSSGIIDYNYQSRADAEASPYITPATTYAFIKGRRFIYSPTIPNHNLYFTNIPSGRTYIYNDPFIDEALIQDPDFFSASPQSNRDAAATAGFALSIPLILFEPNTYAALSLSFTGLPSDSARGQYYASAVAWAGTCLCSGGAKIIVRSPAGPTSIYGQVNIGYISIAGVVGSAGSNQHVILQTSSAVQLNNITNITFGTKIGRPVRANITNPGSGYLDTFPVTATGGGSVGFSAVGYASGGILTGIVITNPGTCSGTPTLDLSAGGGIGAVVTLVVNLNVVPVTLTMATMPSGLVIGQPIGVGGYTGGVSAPRLSSNGDGEFVVGCHKVLGFDTGLGTISFEISVPLVASLVDATSVTNGRVCTPNGWLINTGGYTGALTGIEGAINFNDSTLTLDKFWLLWGDGPNQTAKSLQKGLGSGRGGTLNINDFSGICGFPDQQIRTNMMSSSINRLYCGGGITGVGGIKLQGGGHNVASSLWVGSNNGDNAITVASGVFLELANVNIGSASVGLRAAGGSVTIQESTIAGSIYNINVDDSGNVNFLSGTIAAPNVGMILKRGNVNITGSGPCIINGYPTLVSPVTANSFFPPHAVWDELAWITDAATPVRTIRNDGSGSQAQSAAGVPLLPSEESGIGTPETSLARARGSIYYRTDTGQIYRKTTTGSFSTGWIAVPKSEDASINAVDGVDCLPLITTALAEAYPVKLSGGNLVATVSNQTQANNLASALGRLIITSNSLTVTVGAGVFDFTSRITMNVVNGNRLRINGAAPTALTFSSLGTISSVGPGDHSVTWNVTSAAGVAINDYIAVSGLTGTDCKALEGFWKVTNVAGNAITLQNTCRQATLGSPTVSAATIRKFNTIFRFTSSMGFYILSQMGADSGELSGLRNIGIVGVGAGTFDGVFIEYNASISLPGCAINGFGRFGIYSIYKGTIYGLGVIVSACTSSNIYLANQTTGQIVQAISTGSGAYGIVSFGNSGVFGTSSNASGNVGGHYSTTDSLLVAQNAFSARNSNFGAYAEFASNIGYSGSVAENNTTYDLKEYDILSTIDGGTGTVNYINAKPARLLQASAVHNFGVIAASSEASFVLPMPGITPSYTSVMVTTNGSRIAGSVLQWVTGTDQITIYAINVLTAASINIPLRTYYATAFIHR